ncbi:MULTISPECIES: YitT family protein [Blautia]|uniref:YitT family protein n=1 Tax=Blautia TaxID=572511 RepID=UPI0025909EF1|nr:MULTISPECIES: YitT family protein [Blautia]
MRKTQREKRYRSYLLIILGTGIMSLAINSIYDAMQMVTGGFSGLGIVIKSLSQVWIEGGIPLWITNMVLNIPLFLLGIWIKGWEFTKKSVFGALCLSFWLYLIPPVPLIQDDMLLAVLAAGVIMGVGIGCIFLGQGTTGGTDMAAALIQHKLRCYSIPQILQFIDGSIVLLGVLVFGIHKALYAVVAIFITSWTADRFMEGLHFAKGAYVITDKEELVSKKIMQELNRGLTGIYSQGIYSQKDRKMLFCVVGKKEIVKLKELVEETDPEAFVIVTDVREVLGKGFTREKV